MRWKGGRGRSRTELCGGTLVSTRRLRESRLGSHSRGSGGAPHRLDGVSERAGSLRVDPSALEGWRVRRPCTSLPRSLRTWNAGEMMSE